MDLQGAESNKGKPDAHAAESETKTQKINDAGATSKTASDGNSKPSSSKNSLASSSRGNFFQRIVIPHFEKREDLVNHLYKLFKDETITPFFITDHPDPRIRECTWDVLTRDTELQLQAVNYHTSSELLEMEY